MSSTSKQIVQLHSNYAIMQCRIKPVFVEEIKADGLDTISLLVIREYEDFSFYMLSHYIALHGVSCFIYLGITRKLWSPHIIVRVPGRGLVREKQVPSAYKKDSVSS